MLWAPTLSLGANLELEGSNSFVRFNRNARLYSTCDNDAAKVKLTNLSAAPTDAFFKAADGPIAAVEMWLTGVEPSCMGVIEPNESCIGVCEPIPIESCIGVRKPS